MNLVGRSEAATHTLSLLFALLAIPVAFWAARTLLGERAAWAAALLTALNPFLGNYAQETRMYSLLVLLALVTAACWMRALAVEVPAPDRTGRAATCIRRAPTLGFALAYAAMLYTPNWALFF